MLLWDDVEPDEKVRIYEKGVAIDVTPEERYETLVQYRLGDMVVPKLENYEALRAECTDFLKAIELGTSTISDGKFGTELVEVLEAADKSIMRNGMPVDVEYAFDMVKP